MGNKDNKPLWKIILWAIVTPVVAIVLAVFIGVAMTGFQWHLVLEIFKVHWILFVSVIALTFVVVLLMARHPKGTAVTTLLVVGFVFVLASMQDNQIAEKMREYISNTFDINLLLGAITVMSLALAIATISKREQD